MGIELLIIILIILGILGAGYYLYSNPNSSEMSGLGPPASIRNDKPIDQAEPKRDESILMGGLYPDTPDTEEELDEEAFTDDKSDGIDRKLSTSTEPPPAQNGTASPTNPGQPTSSISQPPQPPAKESPIDDIDLDDDDDEFFDTGAALPAEEPEPEIEELLTSESDDEQDIRKRSKASHEEIVDWMDDLKEQIEGGETEMPSLGESSLEDRLDVTYPEKDIAPATKAHFSAFYPREAQAEQRYGVYIYAHAESMLAKITEDAQKFKEELGGNIPQPRTSKTSKSLAHGTKISVLLESEELEFEPELLTKKWHGDWTRYEFEFRPHADFVDETAFVRASIMVMGFEIAKIKFAIDITAPQMQAMSRTPQDELPTNPFALAKLKSTTTDGYDKIFISYSRKDKVIAEAFKIIQEAAGNDVFFDVDDIRTGEDWQAAIARAIDEADYLQLFWSENSAKSEWCGYEWDYTLKYRCKENKCREFIRPVWWADPMPPPPDMLGHLNFRRMDVEKLMQVDDE